MVLLTSGIAQRFASVETINTTRGYVIFKASTKDQFEDEPTDRP